jgi:predicted transcriptional regulator YheO
LPKNARRSARTIANLKLRLLDDLVPKIARAVGPLCEVVLHQNTSQPPTVLSIGNGHITGRTIGDLMTRVLVNGEDVRDRKTPLFNYLSQMPDGRRIRVSLIPIIDDGKVIAYLSVNFLVQDLSMARQALKLLVDAEPHDEAIHEVFLSPTEVIGKLADDILHSFGRSAATLKKTQRSQLIRRLRDRGVFNMRGSVNEVAGLLGISRTAVYNYLAKLNKEDAK